MDQYTVTGMSCSACSSRIEKAVSQVVGVSSCSVSLLTNTMMVEGSASPEAVIAAVEEAGYGAEKAGAHTAAGAASVQNIVRTEGEGTDAEKRELRSMKRRLTVSLILLLPLMYLSMGHMMWNWPVPQKLADNPVALGLAELLFTVMIMVVNQKFFISGAKGMLHRAPNMDTLVALGSGASFIYSVYVLFVMTDAVVRHNDEMAMHCLHDLYFESAAMILTLITVGKTLETYSKGKTTDALKGLMKLAPKTAVVIRDGKEETVAAADVIVGDIFVVRPGESIPVDGIVIDGNSAVNESALSGESIPVDKEPGHSVSAATINLSGYMKCEATHVGEDTTLAQIIHMVSDAAATKAPIAKIADQVSGIFVPVVILLALLTILVWIAVGESAGFVLARGISVLVISCPCALGLATPVAIMVGNGVGAKQGILFKTAAALEQTGKADMVVLDKTGTITHGKPQVTDVICGPEFTEEEAVRLICSLEQYSEHPLAKAVMQKGAELGIVPYGVEDFQIYPGNGLQGVVSGRKMIGGNYNYVNQYIDITSGQKEMADQFSEEGKTPLYFVCLNEKEIKKPEAAANVKTGTLVGIFAVADVIKEDSAEAVREMKDMGISVVMLTGDNQKTAEAIGRQAGVDRVIAGVLPDGKEAVIKELKKNHKVIMVGDGINDAPALTRADIGIAIGTGTDIAVDAADVVLMKAGLRNVPAALRLSMATTRNIKENLFWAFIYNVIGIPLAAGVWYPVFGWTLNPMFGAFAMSMSSFCVVSNALRLNLVNIYDKTKKYRVTIKQTSRQKQSGKMLGVNKEKAEINISQNETGIETGKEKKMEKVMHIQGMMCEHCEARVKKSLEKLPQVSEAVVSHEKGTAIVTLDADVADAVLKQAVEEQDYEVVSIE